MRIVLNKKKHFHIPPRSLEFNEEQNETKEFLKYCQQRCGKSGKHGIKQLNQSHRSSRI